MVSLHALALADSLPPLLSAHQTWAVFQKFRRGMNLRHGRHLIFLGGPESPLCPFGIRLPEAERAYLLELAQIGDTFSADGEALRAPRAALLWAGAAPVPTGQSSAPSLPAGLGGWLAGHRAQPPSWAEGLEAWRPQLFRYLWDGAGQLPHLLRQIVGYGPGLTPSGDDFLVGLLWAHTLCPFLPGGCLEAIHQAVFCRPATTLTAENYYRYALAGRFSQPMVQLGAALRQGQWDDADRALEALLGLGHTSGQDLWLGAYAGLCVLARIDPDGACA